MSIHVAEDILPGHPDRSSDAHPDPIDRDADPQDRQADGPLGVADRTVGPHDGADRLHGDRA